MEATQFAQLMESINGLATQIQNISGRLDNLEKKITDVQTEIVILRATANSPKSTPQPIASSSSGLPSGRAESSRRRRGRASLGQHLQPPIPHLFNARPPPPPQGMIVPQSAALAISTPRTPRTTNKNLLPVALEAIERERNTFRMNLDFWYVIL
jgi:hypothetical protein